MFLGNPLTEKEVHDVCHNLKCGKAGGFDELVPEHYKYGGHALSQFLCDLFNSIIACEYVPSNFCVAIEIPLFKGKGKDPLCVDNYRKISLMTIISKIFEKLICNRIACMFNHVTLGSLQGGALPYCSSINTSFFLQQVIAHMCEEGHSV